MIYEINHIWTAEMKWKWRNDRRSEHNLCNCVKKPEKKKFSREFFFQASLRNCINCVHCDDHFFIFMSFLQFIYDIFHISLTHFFHGNIWTHNLPASNISGFIAQLVRASHWYREVTGSNPVEVLNFFQASLCNCINCVHRDDHFFIFIKIFLNCWCLASKMSSTITPPI